MDICDAYFCEVWNNSHSRAEVCRKTGLSLSRVHTRAQVLRKHGVPLKRFERITLGPARPYRR